jgi:hypothetical protein
MTLATLQQKPSGQLSKRDKAKIAAEILRVKHDNLYFLENYVWTMDEDAADGEGSFKKFPSRAERPYLYEMAEEWNSNRVMIVEKSRQMMATWLFVSLFLHMTCFHRGRRTFFQSKKEEDAKNLKNRASFIYRRLPKFLQVQHVIKDTKIEFPTLESEIWAIPQGGEHVRSYTVSGFFSDEAAIQSELEDAYAAVLPSIGLNGKLTMVSTPKGKNFFWRLAKDIKR